jgi:hypothetical protein
MSYLGHVLASAGLWPSSVSVTTSPGDEDLGAEVRLDLQRVLARPQWPPPTPAARAGGLRAGGSLCLLVHRGRGIDGDARRWIAGQARRGSAGSLGVWCPDNRRLTVVPRHRGWLWLMRQQALAATCRWVPSRSRVWRHAAGLWGGEG